MYFILCICLFIYFNYNEGDVRLKMKSLGDLKIIEISVYTLLQII